VDFRLLQLRLIAHVRARVRNGEISERSLARLTGISQPHIHNVLKGARLLSADMADQMLHRLRIDLVDLLTADEGGAAHGVPPSQEPADPGECRMVALLDGWIGREHPYPQAAGRDRYPFAAADVEHLESPVAVRLAPDPLRTPIFAGCCVVLLDRSERGRLVPDEEGYFALDLSGGGTIGLVRRARRHLYLWVCLADAWQAIPLPDRDPLDVIQGRVSLVVRHL
jgi:transcriptional regulator with XRE-family HTH domain